MTWDSPTNNELLRENRTLRWKAKQLGKQLGRQGQTIFRLRNEIAALRSVIAVKPGDLERLFDSSRELRVEGQRLRDQNAELQKQLADWLAGKPQLANFGDEATLAGGLGA